MKETVRNKKMTDLFIRTKLLIGDKALDTLKASRVAVFGVGGVGGYVIEALARSGVGTLDIVDHDTVSDSNINRQIIATTKTVGQYKVDVMKQRILEINPEANVNVHKCFYLPETADQFDFTKYDYVVDAIDTVTGKLQLIERAKEAKTPIISSMGAGNKLDPTQFEVSDIYKTSVCPLAKVMRRECKKRGIEHLKVVYSKEKPLKPKKEFFTDGEIVPGSIAFVPSVVGLILGGEVLKDLIS
jgi:tRNA A37 threonylcarbamoyladenosine dehydratase